MEYKSRDPRSDELLMRLVRGGDVRAFETLVARHRPAVSSAAMYTCGPDLADDVVQAAFMSLWRHRDQYRADRGSLRTWLLTIVRHRGIDQMRSRATRYRHLVPIDTDAWALLADQSPASESPQLQVERAESSASVRLALLSLPAAQREVLELAYFTGLSHIQIADRLNLPLGTVKSRVRLGLAKLRGVMDDSDQLIAVAPALAA